jgi:hypothetical protein
MREQSKHSVASLRLGRSRIRLERNKLALPAAVSLLVFIVLGVPVALVSAFTLFLPSTEPAVQARPVGEAQPEAQLSIANAKGLLLEGADTGEVYLVTGEAGWDGAVGTPYLLEGVLVDPQGRVLQRRSARIGPVPNWEAVRTADPALFAGGTHLPQGGESSFAILFDPDPIWRATLRFELRAGSNQ